MSRELELDVNGSEVKLKQNGNTAPDIIQRLEDQADEM
jgi:hypothetical protein